MKPTIRRVTMILMAVLAQVTAPESAIPAEGITLSWEDNYLTLRSAELPTGQLKILYIEAYCRDNSHTTDWDQHTVIGHRTRLRSASPDGKQVELECLLTDGVRVEHQIRAGVDEVDFRIVAHNATSVDSRAHWGQPCIRVGEFTGFGADATDDAYAYLPKCFVFLNGQLTRLPTPDWATEARYTPGQVWASPGVRASDVNPRPLNPHRPHPGLIGCFRADDQRILAVAFMPYQELFQGVIRCLHSDFRFGGIPAGERRAVHGKLYLVPNDVPALLARFERDFGGQPPDDER
jgi:hypothetical protein